MKLSSKYNGRYVEGAGGARLFVEENGDRPTQQFSGSTVTVNVACPGTNSFRAKS